jgi:hypothetical protein
MSSALSHHADERVVVARAHRRERDAVVAHCDAGDSVGGPGAAAQGTGVGPRKGVARLLQRPMVQEIPRDLGRPLGNLIYRPSLL